MSDHAIHISCSIIDSGSLPIEGLSREFPTSRAPYCCYLCDASLPVSEQGALQGVSGD
jgi:hypothetical protein